MLNQEFFILYPAISYTFLALISLAVGSLLNVIIYRLPIMMEQVTRHYCQHLLSLPEESKQTINLFLPRSFCPHCKHLIRAWENIPLLSFLFMRGRCHQCAQNISWRYPLVEALSLGLSLMAASYFGFNITLLFSLLFIWIAICLSFIDLDHQLLPDELCYGLLWLGLLANTQHLFAPLTDAVIGSVIAYLGLWLFIKIFYLITGKIGMGHGDFKLFAAFGAWFGWQTLPFILILSSLTGAIVGIIYLTISKKSKNHPIPFGPFLFFAGIIALFARHYIDNLMVFRPLS